MRRLLLGLLGVGVILTVACGGLEPRPGPTPTPTPAPAPAPTTVRVEVSAEALAALEGASETEVRALLGVPYRSYRQVDPPHHDVLSFRIRVGGADRIAHVHLLADRVVGPVHPR